MNRFQMSVGHHPFKTLAIFQYFLPYPLPSAVFYCYPSAPLPTNCRRIKWMVPRGLFLYVKNMYLRNKYMVSTRVQQNTKICSVQVMYAQLDQNLYKILFELSLRYFVRILQILMFEILWLRKLGCYQRYIHIECSKQFK